MSRITKEPPVTDVNGETGSVSVQGGIWTEDANSAKTVTNQSDLTLSPADEHDQYMVFVRVADYSPALELTINGATSNYYGRYVDGSQFGQASSFNIFLPDMTVFDGAEFTFSFPISFPRETTTGAEMTVGGPSNMTDNAQTIQHGYCSDVSYPFEQFTLAHPDDAECDEITVEVFGRDIA